MFADSVNNDTNYTYGELKEFTLGYKKYRSSNWSCKLVEYILLSILLISKFTYIPLRIINLYVLEKIDNMIKNETIRFVFNIVRLFITIWYVVIIMRVASYLSYNIVAVDPPTFSNDIDKTKYEHLVVLLDNI